ncbi:MAG: hypothetical protein GY751_13160 [Bacteroidetes bacterium]|nr:hypothetical protein [Bacteroidota bacterium]
MRKVYHLGSCSTCIRIIRDLGLDKGFELQDIKKEPMTAEQVDHLAKMAGSYESLFSRRAMKYKSMGLKDLKLDEEDYRKFILKEYTFLKRPVTILDDKIFVGNSPKITSALSQALTK